MEEEQNQEPTTVTLSREAAIVVWSMLDNVQLNPKQNALIQSAQALERLVNELKEGLGIQ
jgi:hypothetical protein